MEENDALVELLEQVLGDYSLHYPNKGQISFNCPVCDEVEIRKVLMDPLPKFLTNMEIETKKNFMEFLDLRPSLKEKKRKKL